jgi:hypothetical protein
MKKPKLLFAALALLIGAASAAGLKVPGSHQDGERAVLQLKSGKTGS